MELKLGHRHLAALGRPAVVGVLNVTPDSFYAGSRVQPGQALVERAAAMVADGADFLEVGGESTGPGSGDVSVADELGRTVPAVEALRAAMPDLPIVVDTWKSAVAEACLAAGADLINDVTAGRGDAAMLPLVARMGAAVVLMYSKDASPRTTIADVAYDDVIATVHAFLEARKMEAIRTGIRPERIIVDPGLGHFVSADPSYSYEILDGLGHLATLGPVMVSPSRKSFLAGPAGLPVSDRGPATVAASAFAACRGASFIRTHDVGAVRRALESVSFLAQVAS